ncbi:ABC transporter permease [Dysgonomonas sp. Marseille-P4677]|uniref:ABC transporter permease n=1 Tax=Dysgonomonas sp. Marseille-P4677 TaxID=2364790 RepID=UPI001913B150|nr:ABC transporter permease [Dysgonomonas sp. Marseille-P4677]MBK5720943.1 ABC transporter permease [Dysgonomonas sp. Marseille-P4677]
MITRNLRTYFKFLSKNKLYSFVSIFGFSISLMFVILLSLYARQEMSVDNFHEKKDRIYLMTHEYTASFGNPVAQFVKDKCPEVEAYVRILSRSVAVGKKGSDKFRSTALFADSTFFNIFSFRLIEGNSSQVLASQQSIVVTPSFAKKVFGSDNPIGKTTTIDEHDYTVTGIMEEIPQNSQIPQCDFILPYSNIIYYWGGSWILDSSDNFGFTMYFLEKEGTKLSDKIPMLLGLFKENFWYYKNGFTDKLEFIPLEDVYFTLKGSWSLDIKTNSKNLIKIYIGIAVLILIIATLNYINMTVAQSGFRGKEAAIKKLLGSSKKSIVLQLLGESLFMTLITFGIGLILAFLSEPFFNNVLTTKLELAQQFTLPIISLFFLLILLITFIAGLIPALVISGFSPLEVVKGTFSKKVKTTYSKSLIIFQYIVAIALLICSFFIWQQSNFLVNHEMGYNQDRILIINNVLDTTQTIGFKNKLLSIAGIEKVSYACGTPIDGGNNMSFEKDGQQYSFQELIVDSDFFSIFGVTIEETGIPATDKTFWINRNAFNSPLTNKNDMTIDLGHNNIVSIAGILNDMHFRSLYQNVEYYRIRKLTNNIFPWHIVIKIEDNSDMFAIANRIQEEYSKYNGGEITDASFVNNTIQKWYEREQKLSLILTAFTLLTIIICIMGVFAMSMYMIKQKEKEIGIRKVNGATEMEILLMLNRSSMVRVLIAFVIANPIAYYAISKWLQDFSYRIDINWWTFALAGIIIALLTLISVSYMTWKAATANPITILKNE